MIGCGADFVHERSFHERLEVDDVFRAQYARRFDTVIRALAIQLQNRYAALMRRAKEIAAMPPADGIKLFLSEIPGAIQLHLYFYENLASDEWLPFLEEEGLLREPLPDAQISAVVRVWGWPVGRYLARMASSDNAATRKIVDRALRALKSSTHPDVQRLGLEIIAVLPADEAAVLVDVIARWLTPETAHSLASPHKIIVTLAWIWVYETNQKDKFGRDLDRRTVGLGEGYWLLRRSFSKPFRKYLKSRKKWFRHVTEFRDSLAHRIPLYVLPFIVSGPNVAEYNRLQREAFAATDYKTYLELKAKQEKSGAYRPWMTHSPTEGAPVAVFHQQMLQDFLTIDECANRLLEEIDALVRGKRPSISERLCAWLGRIRDCVRRRPT